MTLAEIVPKKRRPVVPLSVLRLFARRSAQDVRSWLLPVGAYTLVSGLLVSVLAGVFMYWQLEFAEVGMEFMYRILSAVALFVLALPLINLASAAARLSTRRKDARLAGLRLLGASTWTLRALVLGEAVLQAGVGVLLGGGLYALLIPVLGQLHVDGTRVGSAAMLLPVSVILICWSVLIGLAAVSAALGLRRVAISPLAVRIKRDVPRLHWVRIIVAVGALLAVAVFWRQILSLPEAAVALVGSGVIFGIPMLAMTFAGPWIVSRSARRMQRRTRSPERLIAARTIMADPRAAWRQLQSVVLLAFVAVTVGGGLSVMSQGAAQGGMGNLVADMRTGAVITVLYGFFTVACAVLIDQMASINDRREVWVNLDRLGTPLKSIDKVRRVIVLRPMWALLTVALCSAVFIQAPILGAGVMLAPESVAGAAVVLGLGIGMVPLACALTGGALRSTVRTTEVTAV